MKYSLFITLLAATMFFGSCLDEQSQGELLNGKWEIVSYIIEDENGETFDVIRYDGIDKVTATVEFISLSDLEGTYKFEFFVNDEFEYDAIGTFEVNQIGELITLSTNDGISTLMNLELTKNSFFMESREFDEDGSKALISGVPQ